MSEKLGKKKLREGFAEMIKSAANNSWAQVELYRWEHGELPAEHEPQKALDVSKALENMAMAFSGPEKQWPHPMNIASVLMFCARQLKPKSTAPAEQKSATHYPGCPALTGAPVCHCGGRRFA